MDPKALFNISYGIFMLSSRSKDGKINGCITNTCIQVASNPTRVAIACINGNLTCDMVKESGIFCLSILDQSCRFDTIKRFGMQSGRDVDKFADLKCPVDAKGLPYLDFQTCSVLSCHVVSQQDLGSHTLFIAEIDDAVRTSDKGPLTYNDYQTKVKPRPAAPAETTKKIVGWRCKICGFEYREGSELPADYLCPLCGHPAEDFEPIYE